MTLPAIPLVARRTITTIQEGSVYKERFILPHAIDSSSDVRMEFKDSSGAIVAEIEGEVNATYGHYIEFMVPYAEVETVPNGAGFNCYISLPDDSVGDEHMIRYGTVFRRQLSFPDSPATSFENLPRVYEDNFQRPAGSPGGRWKYLVGQPQLVNSGLLGILSTLLSFLFSFYQAFFMRYYVPFSGDTITLNTTLVKAGAGKTAIAIACSSDGSSYLAAVFDGGANTVQICRGLGPDLSVSGNLIAESAAVSLTIATGGTGTQIKMRYDEVTKTLGVYNNNYTTEYVSWTDSADEVPHGKGYRYFAIGGTTSSEYLGIQVAYIKAQDDV